VSAFRAGINRSHCNSLLKSKTTPQLIAPHLAVRELDRPANIAAVRDQDRPQGVSDVL
jgi:hypothetical protein